MDTVIRRIITSCVMALILLTSWAVAPVVRAGDMPTEAAAKAECARLMASAVAERNPPNIITSPCAFYSDHDYWDEGGAFAYCFSGYRRWSDYGYNDNDFKFGVCRTFEERDPPPPVDPDKNRGRPACPCNGIGDPVNPGTGSKYDSLTLFHGEGSFPLDLTLNYDSTYGVSSAMGRYRDVVGVKRTHSYMRSVHTGGGERYAYVLREDGKTHTFRLQGADWVGDADVNYRLSARRAQNGSLIGWTYSQDPGEVETYDASGRLVAVARQGFVQNLSYNAAGRLDTVADPAGRALHFGYRQDGFVDFVDTPDGRIGFQYDSRSFLYGGRTILTRITWPDSTHRDYLYSEAGYDASTVASNLTGVIDEGGRRIDSTIYDSLSRVVVDKGPAVTGSTSLSYTQASDGSTSVAVTDPTGSTQHIDFIPRVGVPLPSSVTRSCTGCTPQTTSYSYDAAGHVTTRIETNGSTTSFTYDGTGLLLSTTQATGTADAVTTQTTWDSVLRKPLNRVVRNARGEVVKDEGWAYNSQSLVTATCLIDPGVASTYVCSVAGPVPAGVRRTTMTYCTAVDSTTCPQVGLLLTVQGPRTDAVQQTTYRYYLDTDESGCGTVSGTCHHVGDLFTVTDPAGLVTTVLSYDKAGRPARRQAPNGGLTDLTYTPRGSVATITQRASATGIPGSGDATTTMTYNADGTVHQWTDPDGVTFTATYDDAKRLTDLTDATGARVHYTLDVAGRPVNEQVLTTSGSIVRSTSRVFNALGQLIALKDGLGRAVFTATAADSYDASGNLVHSQDGLGIAQTQGFDRLNRLIRTVSNAQGPDMATADTTVVNTVDALGRLSAVTDPDGLTTTYDRDALDQLNAVHSPDTGTATQTFDLAGNRLTAQDATGNRQATVYDAGNRRLSDTYVDEQLNVQYRYDEVDAITGCTGNAGRGQLTRIIEGNSTKVYCYDLLGRVVRTQQTVGAATRTTIYAWTPGHRLQTLTTPNGTQVQYVRDAMGRISSITVTPDGGSVTMAVSQVIYAPFGRVTAYTLGNGQTITRTYDATGALTDVVSPAWSQHLQRDVLGKITAIGDSGGVATPTERYSYDPLGRLTGIQSPDGATIEAYTYGHTGDRRTKVGPGLLTGSYSYTPGTHHLTGVGTTTRMVDVRGNTTADVQPSGAWGYGYNARNRLTVVQKDGATVGTYVLDALGQRVQKTANGITTRFDYDETSQLIGEANGASTRDYVWLDTVPVAVIDHNSATTSLAFVHADALGTPRAVTDALGAVLWEWPFASNPFGERAPTSPHGFVLNLRFPGQYFDAESGLNYNVNRDYEPATGRYIQSDPLGLSAGPSTYAYVGNDPLGFSDSLGLCDEDRCDQLREKITRVRNELAKRYGDLQADTLGLPHTGPMSIGGHQQQFENKQTQLRRLLSEFEALGCKGGIPSDSWDWATKDAPSSSRSRVPTPDSGNVAPLTAAGLVAARVIFVIVNTASELL